jgi:hypothetical protein
MNSLDDLLAHLSIRDWRLGSLCQLNEHDWYACLIDDEGFVHKGTAMTAIGAICFALDAPSTGRVYSYGGLPTIAPATTDLLALVAGYKREIPRRRL